VTLDGFDKHLAQLQSEVVELRRRIRKLRSLLLLLATFVRVSGIRFRRERLPKGIAKTALLRAIDKGQDNTISNCEGNGIWFLVGWGQATDDLQGNIIHHNDIHGIRFYGKGTAIGQPPDNGRNAEMMMTVFDSDIHDNTESGVQIEANVYTPTTSEVQMYNDRIYKNKYGIYLKEINEGGLADSQTAARLKVWNETIADNTLEGMYADNGAGGAPFQIQFLVYNSICWGNNGTGDEYNAVIFEDEDPNWVHYSNFEHPATDPGTGFGADNRFGDMNANPDFVDASYHIQATSENVGDNGDDNEAPQPFDFEGDDRKIDGFDAGDRGADEYDPNG